MEYPVRRLQHIQLINKATYHRLGGCLEPMKYKSEISSTSARLQLDFSLLQPKIEGRMHSKEMSWRGLDLHYRRL